MIRPRICPRCYRSSLTETETYRFIDEDNQEQRWEDDGGHDEGQQQDQKIVMREVLWKCTRCGWNKVAFSAQEPHLGPERQLE